MHRSITTASPAAAAVRARDGLQQVVVGQRVVQVQRLLDGVVLDDAPEPVRALQCEATGDHALRLVIAEGRYHQVKRMFGHFQNKVTRLHRERMGSLALDPALQPGDYRALTAQEIAELG